MLLFDLKDGYCLHNVRLAKRFCCRSSLPNRGQALEFMSQLDHEACSGWRTWSEVWGDWTGAGEREQQWVGFLAFVLIAVSIPFSLG